MRLHLLPIVLNVHHLSCPTHTYAILSKTYLKSYTQCWLFILCPKLLLLSQNIKQRIQKNKSLKVWTLYITNRRKQYTPRSAIPTFGISKHEGIDHIVYTFKERVFFIMVWIYYSVHAGGSRESLSTRGDNLEDCLPYAGKLELSGAREKSHFQCR